MNWLDIVILTVVGFSVIIGVQRGFIRAIAGLVGLGVGIFLGVMLLPFGASLLIDFIPNSNVASIISFAVVVLVVYMLVVLAMWLLDKVVKLTPVSLLNRLAGGLFAFIQSGLGVLILQTLLMKFPIAYLETAVKESKIMGLLSGFIPIVLGLLPFKF